MNRRCYRIDAALPLMAKAMMVLLASFLGCSSARSRLSTHGEKPLEPSSSPRDLSCEVPEPQSALQAIASTTGVSAAGEKTSRTDSAVQKASLLQEEAPTSQQSASQQGMHGNSALGIAESASQGIPLNLVSALAATDAKSSQVAFARWRVQEAYAQAQRANTMWLPSLRMGVAYNRHEGAIQDVAGNVFDTSRGGYQFGLGPHSVGQGSPSTPGVLMNFHAADAIFLPKAAASAAQARSWGATQASSDEMLKSAVLYFELLRAEEDAEIAAEILEKTQGLVKLTGDYARAGQGLESDYDRAKTELALRETDQLRAREVAEVASTRLAVQLRLDPQQPILVQEPIAVPIELFGAEHSTAELIAEGLAQRAELAESRWLVNEAVERLRREKYAPLLPSLLLGVSYNGLSGGQGTNFTPLGDRLDTDAIAYWELRNFGLGDQAARGEAGARVEQAKWREVAILDRVAGEIVEAHTRVRIRSKQIAIAEKGVASALDSYQRNMKRIENSQGLPIEALQAIQALGAARRNYLQTVVEFNVAQFQLLRAIGGSSSRFVGGATELPPMGS